MSQISNKYYDKHYPSTLTFCRPIKIDGTKKVW